MALFLNMLAVVEEKEWIVCGSGAAQPVIERALAVPPIPNQVIPTSRSKSPTFN